MKKKVEVPHTIKVKKIVLELAKGKNIDLTFEQARTLYNELGKLFASKTEYVPSYPWHNYPRYYGGLLGGFDLGGSIGCAKGLITASATPSESDLISQFKQEIQPILFSDENIKISLAA